MLLSNIYLLQLMFEHLWQIHTEFSVWRLLWKTSLEYLFHCSVIYAITIRRLKSPLEYFCRRFLLYTCMEYFPLIWYWNNYNYGILIWNTFRQISYVVSPIWLTRIWWWCGDRSSCREFRWFCRNCYCGSDENSSNALA